MAHTGLGIAVNRRKVTGATVEWNLEIYTLHQNIAGAVDHERVESIAGSSDPDRRGDRGAGAEDSAGIGAGEDKWGGKSEVGVEFEDDGSTAAVFRAGGDVRDGVYSESHVVCRARSGSSRRYCR